MNLVELVQVTSSEEEADDRCPFCAYNTTHKIDNRVKFSNGKVYINGIEGFWSYAKERLLKFPVVSREYFVYYLKELEFRYNFRANLDEMLYNALGGIK